MRVFELLMVVGLMKVVQLIMVVNIIGKYYVVLEIIGVSHWVFLQGLYCLLPLCSCPWPILNKNGEDKWNLISLLSIELIVARNEIVDSNWHKGDKGVLRNWTDGGWGPAVVSRAGHQVGARINKHHVALARGKLRDNSSGTGPVED